MEDQDKKIIPVEVPLSDFLESLKKEQDIFEELKKGNNPFDTRENKSKGGSVGSLIEKDIRQPEEPKFRILLADSGMTRDQEIGLHMWIIGTGTGPGSMSGDHLKAIEDSQNWLEENLTPAEKRQFGF